MVEIQKVRLVGKGLDFMCDPQWYGSINVKSAKTHE